MSGEEAWISLGMRRLQEADGAAALRCDTPDFRYREIHVPHGNNPERYESARIGGAPFVNMPVVVCPKHHQGDVLVGSLGEGAGIESGHRRETHGSQHAIGVHVPHPLVHVEAAGPQFAERPGFEAPLAPWPADGGRHTEWGSRTLPLDYPLI